MSLAQNGVCPTKLIRLWTRISKRGMWDMGEKITHTVTGDWEAQAVNLG